MRDDGQIIDSTLAGDTNAYGELVRNYQDRLFGGVFPIARSREEAEDVVQEAFVQAYLKLDTFQRQSAFYTWLYRIAFNIALGKRRQRRIETGDENVGDFSGLEPHDSSEAPEARMERTEQATQVHNALAALNEPYRVILILREIQDCDYETISKMLDLPIGTVRSRLHRARVMLRKQLQDALDERTDDDRRINPARS